MVELLFGFCGICTGTGGIIGGIEGPIGGVIGAVVSICLTLAVSTDTVKAFLFGKTLKLLS